MLLKARDERDKGSAIKSCAMNLSRRLWLDMKPQRPDLRGRLNESCFAKPVYDRLKRGSPRRWRVHATPEKLAALPYLDATIKEVRRPASGDSVCWQSPPAADAAWWVRSSGKERRWPLAFTWRSAIQMCIQTRCILPERFLNGQPDPASWLPLAAESVVCIGAAFALYEMKIVMGTILAHTELALENDQPADIKRRAITFWPAGGTRLRKLSHPA